MSLVTINTSKTNIANISTVLAEMNIKLNDNSSTVMGYQTATQLRGIFNTAIGYSAARESLEANAMTVFGYQTGYKTQGDSNTFVGAMAGFSNDVGMLNTYMGADAGKANPSGSCNACFGAKAGASSRRGTANTFIGAMCGAAADNVTSSNTCTGAASECTGGASAVLGAGVWNAGANSVCIGTNIRNEGSNVVIVKANELAHVNASDEYLYLNGVVVGQRDTSDGAYVTRVVSDIVSLCYDTSTDTSAVTLTRDVSRFRSSIATSEISLQKLIVIRDDSVNSVPGWAITLAPAPATTSSTGYQSADLVFQSANSNIVVFTDEFAPELFNFTAKHRCSLVCANDDDDDDKDEKDLKPGLIVVATGAYRNLDGSVAPTIDEAVPTVALASEPNDPRVFGVISAFHDKHATHNAFRLGFLRFAVRSTSCQLFSPVSVNSLGEGGIWVCDLNGGFQNGDFIASSRLPGYGMRQSDNSRQGRETVAKITCDCDFRKAAIVKRFDRMEVRCVFVGCSYRC